MTAGKSKRVPKGKKSRKQTDPFAKKEWYDVKAPAPFKVEQVCKTTVNRTAGTRIASEALKNRVYEVSVADLMNDATQIHQVVKLRIEDVKDKNAYTSFYGLRFTTDKLRSLIKKWYTLVNAVVDVRTPDGYTLRMFAVGITKRRNLQVRSTSYAYHSQILRIVARMKDIMQKAAASNDIKELVNKLIFNGIGKDIEKACSAIYPLQNVFIAKVKVLKAPKTDLGRLAELHPSYNQAA